MTSPRGGNLLRLRLVRWLALIVAAAGAPLPLAGQGSLEDVPSPALRAAEDAVRDQLDEVRRQVDALLLNTSADSIEKAEAIGRLAALYHAYDLLDAAAAGYRNAERLAPSTPRWPYLLGVVYRWAGDFEAAAASLERARELPSSNPGARLAVLLQSAEVALKLGRLGEAETLAREALELGGDSPVSAAAHQVLGDVASSSDDLKAAIRHYETALGDQPQATRLHYLLGQLQRRAGNIDSARDHLRQAGQAEVSFADPWLALIYLEVAGSAALQQQGASVKAVGQLEAAVDIYRRAVENDPESPEARRDLGALLAQTGKYRESADQYRAAVRLEPDKALHRFSLALVLEQLENSGGEALVEFRRAVELEPDYQEFRRALADRLAQLSLFAEALSHFEHLLNDEPTDQEARLGRAKVRMASGDLDGALADARIVAREAERTALRAEGLGLLGEALAHKGDGPGAMNAYRKALELEPEFAGAHFGLGNLLGVAGRYPDSAASYRRALEIDPGRSAAWQGEATALALAGREAEAVSRLREGCEILADPASVPLESSLVRLLLTAQDPAVRDPDGALELADALFRRAATAQHGELLAVSLAAVGRHADAVKLLQQMLASLPAGSAPQLERHWRSLLAEWHSDGP
ncbi:MAG: tetratricopeptide repeat protein [Thermoanaerobaculia bacterium]|nr:tetratricopeptide repeat protein [Thermoanaerobaculia bacterium]